VEASVAQTMPGFRRALAVVVRLAERDPAAACRDASVLVRAQPTAAEAHRVLAFVLRRAKRLTEADQADRDAIELGDRQPVALQAREAIAAGKLEHAEILVREHLKRDPEDAAAARMLAEIAVECGAMREGEIFLKRAILLAPGYQVARLSLANLLSRLKRDEDALDVLGDLLHRDADHLDALALKAGILTKLRRMGEAEKTFRHLLACHPRNVLGWLNYGYLLKTINRIDDSVAAYRRALALNGATGIAWWGLANLKTVGFDQEDVAAMRAALARTDLHADDRLHLCFALGKALSDMGDFEHAFASYRDGNRLRRAQFPYDGEEVAADVKRVEQVFSADFFDLRKGCGSPARDPIFIVSLPRSGSTLVEQILASHPLIEGTEELYDLERIAMELGDGRSPNRYLERIHDVSPMQLQALGQEYLTTTRRYRQSERPFFTDKMPSNWKFVGLIRLLLPNAKIIDVRRHPLGCGVGNFIQHFNHGINFSYDLKDIGRFYTSYVRQMAHFDATCPGLVHRVFYEDLVESLEVEVRRMLDYLNLPFDPACLQFFKNQRDVHTPSAEQVRRPITRDGVNMWRNYEQWLEPLKAELGPIMDRYPQVPSTWFD
jgi:tetratricopeptide (TPR) repeat protein